jgi:hypothetical protein
VRIATAPLVAAMLGLLVLVPESTVREAQAYDPPPQASLAATIEQAALAARLTRQIATVTGLDPETVASLGACDRLNAPLDRCADAELGPCRSALVRLYDALRERETSVDAFVAAATQLVGVQVAEGALRLSIAEEATKRGECDRIAPPGGHPVRNVVSGDGKLVLVEPLVPLRAGRRYALVVEGIADEALPAIARSVVPVSDPSGTVTVPPGSFSGLVGERLSLASYPADAHRIDLDRSVELVRRLESEATMPGLPPFSGARITLSDPLTGRQLDRFRAYFAPLAHAPREHTVATFRTASFRSGLAAYRTALARAECRGAPSETAKLPALEGTDKHPSIGQVLRGRYRSLDLRGENTRGSLGTPPEEAAVTELPFFLVMPREIAASTPLVIAVNGIGGKAEVMAGEHADGVTSRGMALLAMDLPDHGERSQAGRNFLDVLDPGRLALNIRQSVVDVMAVGRTARKCGFVLPDGSRFAPGDVRYAGYSLGAMIGSIVRAVDPGIGATVLFAPGGDLLGWLVLNLGATLGADVATCIGGADSGKSCANGGRCAEPGVCSVNPFMVRLLDLARLPYHLASAPGDPLSFVGERTGDTSHAPLVLITGGEDAILTPILPTRLADALGMARIAEHKRRGPHSAMVQWPALGHNLVNHPSVRRQGYDFLASDGRQLPPVHGGAPSD